MPEFWDIYDKDRRKTGRLHQRGLPSGEGEYNVAVHIWTISPDGQILLTLRDPRKAWGNSWESTGGACQAGEESEEAARRELREETGLHAETLYPVGSRRDDKYQMFHDSYAFFPGSPVAGRDRPAARRNLRRASRVLFRNGGNDPPRRGRAARGQPVSGLPRSAAFPVPANQEITSLSPDPLWNPGSFFAKCTISAASVKPMLL